MKTSILFIFISIIGLQAASSQSFETDEDSKENIQKLEFIVGKWKGNGWRMTPDGSKHNFDQSENVQFKLDSTAILIEGQGIKDGTVIHNAMAIITFDKEPGNYSFQSYLQNGMKGNFKAELKEDVLSWYPNENIRYIININERGQWYEIGEINRNGKWMQFFEMTLSKT